MRDWIYQGTNWIAGREPLVVVFLAPWLLFPDAFRPLTIAALSVLPVLWLTRRIAGRPISIHTPLNKPLLLLLLALGPAVLVSPRLDLSLPQATTFLLGIGAYFALVNCDAYWRRPELGAMALTAAGLVVALLALVGVNWIPGKMAVVDSVTERLPSLISNAPSLFHGGFHPNEVGGTLAFLLPVVISFILAAWRRGREPLMGHWQAWAWGGVGVALLMLFVLALTQSRMAILVTALIGGVVIGAHRRSVGVVMIAIVIAAGLLLLIGLFSGHLTSWMVKLDAIGRTAGIQPISWTRRMEIWRNALYAIRDYPLAGCGLHAFAPVAWLNYIFDTVAPSFLITHAHNLWLQAGVDFGLIGFIAFAWLTVVALLLGWAIQRRRQDQERTLLAGLWLGLLAWLGHGILHAIPLGAKPSPLIWVMMGFLMATWSVEDAPPAPVVERESQRLRWVGSVIGLALMALLVSWLLHSSLWSLNRGANVLDRALLAEERTRLPEALTFLSTAGELPGVLRRRALDYYESGRPAQAVILFGRDEQAEQYLVSRGRWLIADGSLDRAREFVIMGLEVAPESGRLACLAGDACRLEGNFSDALEFYRMVPDGAASFGDDTARLAACYYQLGMHEKQVGRWSEAAEWFGAAVALDAAQVPYRAEHGRALYQATGELSQAVAIEEAALDLDPDAVEVMLILVDMYLPAERPQKALEWSEKAVAAEPSNPETWLRLAQAHWALEQPAGALETLAEVLRLDPENAQAIALQTEWESQ